MCLKTLKSKPVPLPQMPLRQSKIKAMLDWCNKHESKEDSQLHTEMKHFFYAVSQSCPWATVGKVHLALRQAQPLSAPSVTSKSTTKKAAKSQVGEVDRPRNREE